MNPSFSFAAEPAQSPPPSSNISPPLSMSRQVRGASAVGDDPACFGVLCERHSRCARYHAVNGPTDRRIGTCDITRTVWPLFVAIKGDA